MRVKRGVVRTNKHKKIIKLAKGYQGRRKSVFKLAKQAVIKAGQYSYRDRKVKKRTFRSSWIVTINAAIKPYNISYSQFINGLKKSNIEIHRKMLADLAQNNPDSFKMIVQEAK